MIEFKNVGKKYGDFIALDSVSFTIQEHEIFGIVGTSGAGKSTLLRTINQLEKVDSGCILVDGEDITHFNQKQLREYRSKVAMIFQSFALLDTISVYKNIALPLQCAHVKKKLVQKKVAELARLVGIENQLDKKPSELSGGQKQRVAIARSLTMNPKILLADEATSALDPITTNQILDLLVKINKEFGISIVLVSHQMEVIKKVCDRVCIIANGKIRQIGETSEVFLSSKSEMVTLVNDVPIITSHGCNIKLFFNQNASSASLISHMARSLNIDFSIEWGKLEQFKENVLGSLIINVKEEEKEKVLIYLKEQSMDFEVMKHES